MSESTKKESTCCSLGRRADIGGINAALRAGMSVREVAKTFGVGKTSVSDHRGECLKLGGETSAREPRPVEPVKPEAKPEPDSADSVRGQSGQVSVAPRARLGKDPKLATTFEEQALAIADMIAVGQWEGRPSVRWLSALWGISVEAVRERHRAGAVAAAADRGQIDAERQQAIGALQEQERIALEAFEASKMTLDEEGEPSFGAGDAKFLAIAQKARAEIARIAGCIPGTGTTVNVNIVQSPAFMAMVDAALDALRPWPDARAAVVAAWNRAAKDLEQPAPAVLLTTGEEIRE